MEVVDLDLLLDFVSPSTVCCETRDSPETITALIPVSYCF